MFRALSWESFQSGAIAWLQAYALLLVVAGNLMTMLLMMHMGFYTVAYYHDVSHSLVALWAGAVLFFGLAAGALHGEHVWCSGHGNTRGVATAGVEAVVAKGERVATGKI